MSDPPANVQIRIDGHKWRYWGIKRAKMLYDVNRSDAIAYACKDVCQLVEGIEEVLNRDDLSTKQRQEIAETLTTPSLEFKIDLDVSIISDI